MPMTKKTQKVRLARGKRAHQAATRLPDSHVHDGSAPTNLGAEPSLQSEPMQRKNVCRLADVHNIEIRRAKVPRPYGARFGVQAELVVPQLGPVLYP